MIYPAIDILVQIRLLLFFALIGATTVQGSLFGLTSGPVLLADVACRGFESRLEFCPSMQVDSVSCSHSSDVGIRCVEGLLIIILMYFFFRLQVH